MDTNTVTGTLLTIMSGLVGVASSPYYAKILFAEGKKLYLPATQKEIWKLPTPLDYNDEWVQPFVSKIERITFVLKCNSE